MHAPTCDKAAAAGTCPNHKVIAHDFEGLMRWCDFCGRDTEGVQIKRGSGGWGTPR